ncbi:hypothetical protein MAR_016550 [Mya arenaria]|uniref:Uncharacterized protein n=1 Tax=Mya arenaria TaxID=6604 RepID=A0ABY7FNV1_MYAAR|nr:hypothetical protein MAR_016550 [Mya arenaria]
MPTPFNDLDGTKDTRLLYKPEGSMDADDGHLSVSMAGSTDTLATDVTISSEKLTQPEGCLGKTKRVAQAVYKAARTVSESGPRREQVQGGHNKLLVDYESAIREAIKNDVTTDSTVEVWTYWGSLFFVWTVYTNRRTH